MGREKQVPDPPIRTPPRKIRTQFQGCKHTSLSFSPYDRGRSCQGIGDQCRGRAGRIRRGTLPLEREGRTVYVLLDAPLDDRTTDDQSRKTVEQPNDCTDFLIAVLQDRVRSLEEAKRQNRGIIAALTSRIPAIEAPQEPPESFEAVGSQT